MAKVKWKRAEPIASEESEATSNTAASAGIGANASSEGIRFSARGQRHASSMPSGTTKALASNVLCPIIAAPPSLSPGGQPGEYR